SLPQPRFLRSKRDLPPLSPGRPDLPACLLPLPVPLPPIPRFLSLSSRPKRRDLGNIESTPQIDGTTTNFTAIAFVCKGGFQLSSRPKRRDLGNIESTPQIDGTTTNFTAIAFVCKGGF